MASQHGKKKFRGRGGCRNLYCCKGGWRTSRYYIIILFDICARTQTCVYIVLFYLTGQELVVRFSVVVGLCFFFMFWWVCGEDLYLLTHYPVSSCYVVSSICKFRLAVCSWDVRSFVYLSFICFCLGGPTGAIHSGVKSKLCILGTGLDSRGSIFDESWCGISLSSWIRFSAFISKMMPFQLVASQNSASDDSRLVMLELLLQNKSILYTLHASHRNPPLNRTSTKPNKVSTGQMNQGNSFQYRRNNIFSTVPFLPDHIPLPGTLALPISRLISSRSIH